VSPYHHTSESGHQFTVDSDIAHRRGLMEEAIALMAAGRVRAPRATRLPLAEARHAHELLDRGGALGKLVLVP